MNAITEARPATTEDLGMAADVIIPEAELRQMYERRRAERAREARRQRRATLARNGTIFAQWVVIGGMALSIASLLPLVRIEPIFVYVREDGTSITSRAWQDVPVATREASVLNILAEYIRLREGYSSGEADRAWTVVSALSTKPVRDQFQKWYHRDNPESPQRTYGERASVRVVVNNVEKDATTPDAYRVFFTRTERTNTQEGRPLQMMASLRIRYVDAKLLPWWQRVQFNSAAVQVWEYPGSHPVTPQEGAR
jgi:type IV secretion system protein VirB8